jgi:hypothetical protein
MDESPSTRKFQFSLRTIMEAFVVVAVALMLVYQTAATSKAIFLPAPAAPRFQSHVSGTTVYLIDAETGETYMADSERIPPVWSLAIPPVNGDN